MAGRRKKEGTSPLEAGIAYLAPKARTVREMELKLDSLEYGEYEVYAAVEKLKELGYLDDEKYAADFVASRLASKPVSRRKLRDQLYSHKLSPEVIDAALENVSDDDEDGNAEAAAEKFWAQLSGLETRQRRERVFRRLSGRGYDYETIRRAIARAEGNDELLMPVDDDI